MPRQEQEDDCSSLDRKRLMKWWLRTRVISFLLKYLAGLSEVGSTEIRVHLRLEPRIVLDVEVH